YKRKLLRPGWRKLWQDWLCGDSPTSLEWAWFEGDGLDKPSWECLKEVFRSMIALLVEGSTRYHQEKLRARLKEGLCEYLSLRVPVQNHEARTLEERSESTNKKRACYDRDHTWLRWSKDEGMTPARIRDQWNSEHRDKRIATGKRGIDVVKKGIKKARTEPENI